MKNRLTPKKCLILTFIFASLSFHSVCWSKSNLFSREMMKLLPSSIEPYFEKEMVNLVGTLEIRAALNTNEKKEAIEYLLMNDDGSSSVLHFYKAIPDNLKTGQKIRIRHAYLLPVKQGVRNRLVLSGDDITIVKDVAIPTSLGAQKTLVFAVNFQDQPTNQPWPLQDIRQQMINIPSNVFLESSYHQTTLAGDLVGWYTLSINSNQDCSVIPDLIRSQANAVAINAGVDVNSYTRRIYIFPTNNTCGWAGLGTVGGYPSSTWINGYNIASVATHEVGHNFGLWHSRLLRCQGSSNQGTCSIDEYGDGADTMGSGDIGHFNAFQKDRLGWLNYNVSPPINAVTATGVYTITPYEFSDNTFKALKILKGQRADGSSDYYYVEFRQPIGADLPMSQPSNGDFTKGVLVHQGNTLNSNSSDLLDMTPADGNGRIAALLPGMSCSDLNAPNGGVTIKLLSMSSAGANVSVNFGNAICQRFTPGIAVSPIAGRTVRAGGATTYAITVKNKDTPACGTSTFFYTTPSVPAGLQAVLNPNSIDIAPGESKNVTLAVGTSASTTPASYLIGVTSTVRSTLKVSVNAKLNVTA
jgi:hypothetical protein